MAADTNRRIAKNTLFLYLRMIVTMGVTLYTARVVLATLGEIDYGIYNVIGGVIVLFSFLNSAMNNATQRFLSYEIGRGDFIQLSKTFSMSINCHAILSLLILVFAETVGLWFVWTQLNIPIDRHYASLWVYQFTILTFIVGILRVPYNASIIAHEKMSFYAYVSIIEAILNLVIVYFLITSSFDKLIFFAFLKFAVSVVCWLICFIFCKKKINSCRYFFFWDSMLLRNITSFSGWSMLGGGATLVSLSGSNILLNVFNGVTVNAAYGIANQVSAAIYGFVSNFQLAFQPQIVKLYAEEKYSEQISLINRASKVSFFLLFIISVPFILNADFVLGLWLGKVPKYAADFCIWMLVYSLIDSIQAPLWMAIGATGKIKYYSIWSCSLAILSLPATWILLSIGYSPIWVFVVRVLINLLSSIIRIFYVRYLFQFPSYSYIKEVILRAIPVTLLSFIPCYLFNSFYCNGFIKVMIFSLCYILFTGIIIFVVGLNRYERQLILGYLRTHLCKFN